MSCAHPWLYQPHGKKYESYHYSTNQNALYIPCGWCLNCRVDKQNELTHRCEKELINYKCGAFVTLTYDDYHIVDKMVKDSSGNPAATLSRSDLTHYLYRLRSNIKNRLPDNMLSNHHFKYLAVGEYGGDGQIFDRPHIHLLLSYLIIACSPCNCLSRYLRTYEIPPSRIGRTFTIPLPCQAFCNSFLHTAKSKPKNNK